MKKSLPFCLQKFSIFLLLVGLTLTGCKKDSGGSVTGSGKNATESPEAEISFASEDSSYLPGEITSMTVTNFALEEDTYEAMIDNSIEIELIRVVDEDNSSLIFVMPEIPEGDHSIKLPELNDDTSLAFTVKGYEPIEEPEKYVEDFTADLKHNLEEKIEEAEGAVKEKLQNQLTELENALNSENEISEDEFRFIARLINTNFDSNNSTTSKLKRSADIEECNSQREGIAVDMAWLVGSVAVTAGAVYSLKASLFTGVIGPVAAAIAGGISGGVLLVKLDDTLTKRSNLIDACYDSFVTWAAEAVSKQKRTALAFEHGETKALYVRSEYDLPDDVYDILEEIQEIFNRIKNFIPASWIEQTETKDYKEVRTEDPAGISIKTISDDRISGTAAEAGDQLEITLEYKKQVLLDPEPGNFTLELENGEDSRMLNMQFSLKPLVPIAHEQQVTVSYDSTGITGTLEADYAAEFAIDNVPAFGTVTLEDEESGKFRYQVEDEYTGVDSFTFTAGNSTGISDVATVTIQVSQIACEDVQLVDNDGNEYNTVQIGDQCWMAENMNTTTSAGGNSIDRVCYDDDESNCEIYGGLYEYSTARSVCFEGWHLPERSDWEELIDYLGGESVAGGMMKTTGTQFWESPNSGASNSSGFSGLPGGYRGYDLYSVNNHNVHKDAEGWWWSSSLYDNRWDNLFVRMKLSADDSQANIHYAHRYSELSVRCIRD